MKRHLAVALGVLLLAAPGAFAQIRTGNIYGTVSDPQGGVLPGVTVTLSGDLGTRTAVTSPQGEFRFLALDSGRYKLTLTLAGFAETVREIVVTTGENVNLPLALKVAGVTEVVEVSGETPLVDVKKRGTSTTMVADELQKMPNARDPWGVLKNVPGVTLDRMNIAGNENGQQANAGAKGSIEGDKMWSVDGLVVTDMTATGGSPSYFDFDAFQEIAVTTGGADLQVQAGGIGINLVTKRGTNKFRGGARGFLTHDDLQSSNLPDALVGDPRLENPDGSFRDKADHIQQISDFGFDLGGPILKDRLWFYGSWGKQDIRLVRLIGTPDKTLLTSYNAKLNWQATRNTMVSAFFFDGKKEKTGRSPGSGLNEPSTFLWDQSNAYEENRPHGLWKLEVAQTFSPNFFVSAKAAYYNTGFGLFSRDQEQSYTYDYVQGETVGAYYDYFPVRPQKTLNADGSYFAQGLGGSHELKFGFGYREVTTSTNFHWTGNQLVGYINSETDREARLYREGSPGGDRQVHELLRGRRLHPQPALPQPGRTLRLPEGEEHAGLGAGERFLPRPPARPAVRGRLGLPDRLDDLLAAGGPELRARQQPEVRAPRLLRALPDPAPVHLGAGREPGRPRLPGLRVERRQRRPPRPARRGESSATSGARSGSTPTTRPRRGPPRTRSTAT